MTTATIAVPAFPAHAPQYGAIDTYRIAAEWLDGHGEVCDWGAGHGFAAQFFRKSTWIGIDGTFAGRYNLDLAKMRHACDSILMRHVLENNPEGWRQILENAVASFRRRMALVTFTAFADETHVYKTERHETGELSYLRFRIEDLTDIMGKYLVGHRAVQTTHPEHVFFLQK